MHLQSITIAGFRCFSTTPHLIELGRDLLAIVGPNASGKTAVLQALCKLFGVTRAQRTVRRSDFHLPPGVPPDDRTTRIMSMDVIIALPELATGSATSQTVAPAFRHMQVAAPGAAPVCRMRLEAQLYIERYSLQASQPVDSPQQPQTSPALISHAPAPHENTTERHQGIDKKNRAG